MANQLISPNRRGFLALSASLFGGIVYHASAAQADAIFNPQPVTINGYNSDAMEPFLSRNGRILFFNNSNDPHVNTNLHWATRVDALNFQYKGEISGVNTDALEGVASMDIHGTFYFVSTRNYDKTSSTIYWGKFKDGAVDRVELVPGISTVTPGIVNFDAEISADGKTLYFVESQFSIFGTPKTAKILIARRIDDRFIRDPQSEALLANINIGRLNYAPSTIPSQLEIFFTTLDTGLPLNYRATRPDINSAFGKAERIEAIVGLSEAVTVAGAGKAIYFHSKIKDRYVIMRANRN